MTADLHISPEAVALLVEQYGSIAHLAEAIGVTPLQLRAWCNGTERVPLEQYREMIDIVAAARGPLP